MLVISQRSELKIWLFKLFVLLSIALLAGLLPNLLIASSEAGLVVLLSFVLLIILIMPLIFRAVKDKFDAFEPIIICVLMFVIGYPLRALSIVYLEDLQLTLRPLEEQETIYYLTLALFYAIIGVVMFYWGYGTRFGNVLGKKLFVTSNQWSTARTKRIIILFSISGLFFYFFLMERAGGLVHFITHMGYRAEMVQEAGAGYVRWGPTLMPVATIIWYIHYLTKKKSNLFWAHFATSSLLLISLGGRSEVILFWLTLLIIYHYLAKKISFKRLSIIAVLFFLFVSLMLVYRTAAHGEIEDFRTIVAEGISLKSFAQVASGDFNMIDRFILIIRGVTVTGELDLKFGRTIFIDPLLMPIPRAIWPDKPVLVGRLFVEAFLPDWEGIGAIPPSLLGELYLNFLLPGIILGMFLFGVACKILRSYLDFNSNNKGVIAVYAISITLVLGLALSGNFGLGVIYYLFQMIPLVPAIIYMSGNRILASPIQRGFQKQSNNN